jgi:hypothetical protein
MLIYGADIAVIIKTKNPFNKLLTGEMTSRIFRQQYKEFIFVWRQAHGLSMAGHLVLARMNDKGPVPIHRNI